MLASPKANLITYDSYIAILCGHLINLTYFIDYKLLLCLGSLSYFKKTGCASLHAR